MTWIRWSLFAGAFVLLVWICTQHEHGGSKGRSIPLENVFASIGVSAVAAFGCRFLSRIATPIVGGIAGGFGLMSTLDTPFGAVVGILVGSLVALWPARNQKGRPPEEHVG